MTCTLKIVAAQPAATGLSPETTLERVEDLIRAAASQYAPDLIVLPSALTVGNQAAGAVPSAVRPIDGAPLQLLRLLSRELDVILAAGFHARRGDDVYAAYAVVQPGGGAHLSNSSSLLPEEARHCATGHLGGFTRLGGIPAGVLSGLEWAEGNTARRFPSNVQVVLGGMAWPTAGGVRRMAKAWTGSDDPAHLDAYVRSLPLWQTRLLGVPAVLAVHGGSTAAPGIGATQIVDGDGTVLASLPAHDGEGYVAATVTFTAEHRPRHTLTGRWVGQGPRRIAYETSLRKEALAHQRDRLAHRYPWQRWPGGDLPDDQGPAHAHALAQAATFDWRDV